jgi:hypothetical protein
MRTIKISFCNVMMERQEHLQKPIVLHIAQNRTTKESSQGLLVATNVSGTVSPIDDNSNPQQGTVDSPTAVNIEPPSQQPRKVSTGEDEKTAFPINNSNFTGNKFVHDGRKLFVGGLPQDSKLGNALTT